MNVVCQHFEINTATLHPLLQSFNETREMMAAKLGKVQIKMKRVKKLHERVNTKMHRLPTASEDVKKGNITKRNALKVAKLAIETTILGAQAIYQIVK